MSAMCDLSFPTLQNLDAPLDINIFSALERSRKIECGVCEGLGKKFGKENEVEALTKHTSQAYTH